MAISTKDKDWVNWKYGDPWYEEKRRQDITAYQVMKMQEEAQRQMREAMMMPMYGRAIGASPEIKIQIPVTPKPKTFKQELRAEIDAWLEGALA